MELHIKIIGFLFIVLAFVHLIFPKKFNWKKELSTLSLINKEIMIIHTFFIAVTVFLMGVLCLSSSDELTHTAFGKNISFGLGVFWALRLYIQFFGYSAELWKGKTFETSVHILFTFIWAYVSVIFLINYLN